MTRQSLGRWSEEGLRFSVGPCLETWMRWRQSGCPWPEPVPRCHILWWETLLCPPVTGFSVGVTFVVRLVQSAQTTFFFIVDISTDVPISLPFAHLHPAPTPSSLGLHQGYVPGLCRYILCLISSSPLNSPSF